MGIASSRISGVIIGARLSKISWRGLGFRSDLGFWSSFSVTEDDLVARATGVALGLEENEEISTPLASAEHRGLVICPLST